MADLMQWLEGLKGGAPTAVGAIIGSGFGFITLVLGALFNAHLNRQRDDTLRKMETRAVAAAIRAELAGVEESLTDNAKRLIEKAPTGLEGFLLPDLTHSVRIFPKIVDKLGLLEDPTIIAEIVGAYVVIDQYCENLLIADGKIEKDMPEHRRLVLMPHQRASFVADMNTEMAMRLRKATNSLNRFLD